MADDADIPIACTLQPDAIDGRVSDWKGVLAHALTRTELTDGALRVEFDQDLNAGELAELVVAEQRCCAFFSFAITVDSRGVALQVSAPADAAQIVSELFG